MFADGYTGAEIAGLVTAALMGLGGLITVVAAAYLSIRKGMAEAKKLSEDAAIERYARLLERLEKQIERHERHAESQQRAIEDIADDHSRCQQQVVSFWEWMQRTHELLSWLSGQARMAGLNPGPEIALPESPERRERPEQAARQSAQNTQLLKDSHPIITPGNQP